MRLSSDTINFVKFAEAGREAIFVVFCYDAFDNGDGTQDVVYAYGNAGMDMVFGDGTPEERPWTAADVTADNADKVGHVLLAEYVRRRQFAIHRVPLSAEKAQLHGTVMLADQEVLLTMRGA